MRILLFTLLFFFAIPAEAQTNWYHLPNAPLSSFRFSDMYFTNDSTGWIIGGSIFKTTNAGETWELQLDSFGSGRSIEFFDAQAGFAGTVSGKAYSTLDGGEHWDQITDPAFDTISGICGMSHYNNSIFMCGAYNGRPKFIKSSDRGVTWSAIKLDSLVHGLVDCYFLDDSVGFITGSALIGGIILKTTNGGVNWRVVAVAGGLSYNYVWKLQFTSTLVGYASVEDPIDDKAHFLKTIDGGENWILNDMNGLINFRVQGLWFANDTLGWVGGWINGLFETRDAGTSWQYIPAGGGFNRFFQTPSGKLYAAGRSIFTHDPYHFNTPDTSTQKEILIHKLYPLRPNPASDKVTISYDLDENTGISLQVIEASGKKVAIVKEGEQAQGHYEMEFSLSGLAAGVYHVVLLTHEMHHSQKLVVHR
jgi:photosystem II stability/assembly factor-like uncharacterized protein